VHQRLVIHALVDRHRLRDAVEREVQTFARRLSENAIKTLFKRIEKQVNGIVQY
jgi:hypothetical protein